MHRKPSLRNKIQRSKFGLLFRNCIKEDHVPMASCEQGTIEQASLHETPAPDATTEATPLVTSNHVKNKSVLFKSKAAIMILFWTALMSFIYGGFLNPENYFLMTYLLMGEPSIFSSVFNSEIIDSCIYAVFAFWLLFYPLAGYLADVRYGRYKVVRCGVCTTWCGLLTFVLIGGIVNAIILPIMFTTTIDSFDSIFLSFVVVIGILGLFLIISFLIAFAGFLANVIQFGVDQLNESPSRDSFLFIHWFLFTLYVGISFGKLVWSAANATGFLSLSIFGLVVLVELICIPVTFCVAKRRWFVIGIVIGNPYKEVAGVVNFARRNKIPIQRSAFTFWEDDIPTGLDLGKDKYGGPFTTEQVENVKSFFGIFILLFSVGPFFTADIAAAPFLSILKDHMKAENILLFNTFSGSNYIVDSMFTNGGTLYPVFLVVFVPIFLKFIHPLFQKFSPGILRRIGIGLCLVTVSLFCSLFVEMFGHLPSHYNATISMFDHGHFVVDNNNSFVFYFIGAPSLNLSPYILIIQQVLVAVAYVFIYGGVFEFICIQSPHSMKGFLIGIFFAIKGLFQLIGVLGILLPFSIWHGSPFVGLVYFLVNILISVAGVVVFIVAAKRYQYHHNREFEDLDVHFEYDSDSETQ
ncbi:solute carrier family 15 member 3-like [Halichondria panicea]|uniref:solute carrier family 15 member 3-like n=1 Tax=Halichondria panicea TaxID=6063 RepID=UPI00312BA66B